MSDVTQSREAEQRLVASEAATRALADEQAALRRIATLVAGEAPPSAVFEQVTAEVARLLSVPSASVLRYEADGRATVVGSWRDAGLTGLPLGASLDLDGDSVIARVHRSGAPERIDDYEDAPGALAERLRALGYRVVRGGTAVASAAGCGARWWPRPRSPGAWRRARSAGCCDFAELVAQALSNADAYDKLAASRARIVEAGDAERRRLERNLHDGAQQRLVSLALQLRMVEGELDSQSRPCPQDARRRSRAARPRAGGAAGAGPRHPSRDPHRRRPGPGPLRARHRAPVPVEISDVPAERLPEPVEAAAYYLIAEAITNVAKHANASHVAVSVRRDDVRVLVQVADDGIGGADPVAGSGLHGLADRVEALHGQLRVDSPPGRGTRLEARIPVGPT